MVYVVNRRTVVDQSTDEARKLRDRLKDVPGLVERLQALCANATNTPLAISTLRGQFADNREWSADPARPAVIAGTVDMIGSRLLFSGYGCGFKSRPLQAGFLGQDALLVHDEAHLEPAFQELITAIEREQRTGRTRDIRPLRVMELTATSRADGPTPFMLTDADLTNETVKRRLFARKGIVFHGVADEKQTPDAVAGLALGYKDSKQAILVFLSSLDAVHRVEKRLRKAKQAVQLLTGTLRGYERDALPKDPIFARFLPESNRGEKVTVQDGTVYLICTSAGEVGVNVSGDHLGCDLNSFESMAQRFGRVNRFGEAHIDIVHPKAFDTKDKPRDAARESTLALLRRLPQRDDKRHDASPHALDLLPPAERQAAFSTLPWIPPTSPILFDAWALTTVREALPGRPPIAEYLHGVSEGEPPETHVAWREEVELLQHAGLSEKELGDLLDDYPLKPHELVRDQTRRVFEELEVIAARGTSKPEGAPRLFAWVIHPNGELRVLSLPALVEKDRQKKPLVNLAGCTVVLPPAAGGLQAGLLRGAAERSEAAEHDVADRWEDDRGPLRRRETISAKAEFSIPTGWRRVAEVPLKSPTEEEEAEVEGNEPAGQMTRVFLVRLRAADDDGSRVAQGRVPLDTHHSDAARIAEGLANRLLPKELQRVPALAARFHDLGKRRDVWQRSIGNTDTHKPLAKSGRGGALHRLNDYRHEFGSLIDIQEEAEFKQLSPEEQDLVMHLIATHHGRGRPHFPAEEAFDLARGVHDAARIAREAPRRFGRLQRKYGRWGLAWLESLLRAADNEASANPSEVLDG
jgi:CRISPR-associated endonuclease/helicase Cas3